MGAYIQPRGLIIGRIFLFSGKWAYKGFKQVLLNCAIGNVKRSSDHDVFFSVTHSGNKKKEVQVGST